MKTTKSSYIVSVIIPCYNAEDYIEETVQSAIDQSYSNVEIIVVNDGSTDDSLKLIKALEKKHPQIIVISQVNKGVSSARNKGLERAQGEFICFLDSDDVWLNNWVEKMVNFLIEEKNIGLVHSDVEIIDGMSKRTGSYNRSKGGYLLESLLKWDSSNFHTPSNKMVRREVIDRVGGFEEELSTAADQEFLFRVAHQYEIGRLPEVLCLYRIHANNMHNNIGKMETDHLLAYKKTEENGLFKSWKFKSMCFSNMYMILGLSWWKYGNKLRGLYFITKSTFIYPPNIIKPLSRLKSLIS